MKIDTVQQAKHILRKKNYMLKSVNGAFGTKHYVYRGTDLITMCPSA